MFSGEAGKALLKVTVTGDLDVSGTVTLANPLAVTSGGTGLDILTGNAVVFTDSGSTGVDPALSFMTFTSSGGSIGVVQFGDDNIPFVSNIIDGGTY